MKKIGEWATQSRLDPNDPKNASIMQLLQVGIRKQYGVSAGGLSAVGEFNELQ